MLTHVLDNHFIQEVSHLVTSHIYMISCLLARAHPDLNQGPADLQSAALTTELCTHVLIVAGARKRKKTVWHQAHATGPNDQGTRLQTWSAVAVKS